MTDNPGNQDIIKLMLKRAWEKLETARINFDNQRYNDTVSRAYYAIFHAISAVLMSKNLHFSSHKETIGAFTKEFIKPGTFPKSFSTSIQKLFAERQTGDYDFTAHIEPDIASEDLEKVQEILLACEHYLSQLYCVPIDYWMN